MNRSSGSTTRQKKQEAKVEVANKSSQSRQIKVQRTATSAAASAATSAATSTATSTVIITYSKSSQSSQNTQGQCKHQQTNNTTNTARAARAAIKWSKLQQPEQPPHTTRKCKVNRNKAEIRRQTSDTHAKADAQQATSRKQKSKQQQKF